MTKKNPDLEATAAEPAKIPEGEEEAAGIAPAAAPLDLAGFAAGFGAPRDYVPLYKRFDLLADRTGVLIELEDAKAAGDRNKVQRLRKEAREITEQIRDTRVVVEIRAMGLSRREEVDLEAASLGIIDPLQKLIFQTAQQVVAPLELQSYEVLRDLSDVIGGQVARIIATARTLNDAMELPTVPL